MSCPRVDLKSSYHGFTVEKQEVEASKNMGGWQTQIGAQPLFLRVDYSPRNTAI